MQKKIKLVKGPFKLPGVIGVYNTHDCPILGSQSEPELGFAVHVLFQSLNYPLVGCSAGDRRICGSSHTNADLETFVPK